MTFTYHLLLPRHGNEKSSRDRNRSGEHVNCYSGRTGRIPDSLFYHLYGFLSCECGHYDPEHRKRKNPSSPLDVAYQSLCFQNSVEPCRKNEYLRLLERHRLLQYEPGSFDHFPCMDADIAAPRISGAVKIHIQQITSKLIFLIFLNQTTRYCSFLFLLIPTSFLVLTINKLLASYYAQKGIYFIYLGAVFGSSGFINCNLTASLIKREILPADESFMPKRSLKELFVNCSPCTCLIHACR